MQTSATAKYVRSSPQKCRLVADQVRNKPVGHALDLLRFSEKKAARLVLKVLESAIANAEHNEGADIDALYIEEVQVNEGPVLKRWRPRAKGRSSRIWKRSCHITMAVGDSDSTGR